MTSAGLRSPLACLDPRWAGGRPRLLSPDDEAFVVATTTTRPDGAPIYVILDNPSAHKNWRIRTWARKNKAELCFTPTYASWANPVEAYFGTLRQFAIAGSGHPNHVVQTRALHAYLRRRDANARHPGVPAAQRSEPARIRSEKGIRFGGRPLPHAA
ncbi:transposase [Streptosporangium algeriense]|uniref:Transposase n=1 Tax=Streptosporangium algeriense TaxID=1682748 RepID=A0ABW3DI82_9ACTN